MKTAVIIPAHLESTRLPSKMLLDETGHPLIYHTYQMARQIPGVDDVIIATDSASIAHTMKLYDGCRVEMTGPHRNGTSRVAEVAKKYAISRVINIQGDEPEIPLHVLMLIAAAAQETRLGQVTTFATSMHPNDASNPNQVKVVSNLAGDALYFSRAPIPHNATECWRHMGVYIYGLTALCRITSLNCETQLDVFERLEQLRWLEAGVPIKVRKIATNSWPGIDTRDEYDAFVRRYRDSRQ